MAEYRLLVVDDDQVLHRLFTDIAQARGYSVNTATELKSFKMVYSECKPTIIFLDLKLLEGDGIEVLRYLSEIECKCPIVIISGHDARVRASALRLGESKGLRMEASFQKPVDVQTIVSILEKYKNGNLEFSIDDFKKAIENQEFILHYQPIVSVNPKRVVGAEVLTRWKVPNKELIYPDNFIPFAERTGLISQLSRYIIKKTMQQMQAHQIKVRLSINLSPRDLVDLHLADEIVEYAKQYHIDSSQICFEITETAVMSQPKIAMDILTRLRINDFALAMDDFGTGYSSLVELYHMPFSQIKMDKSIVMDLQKNSDAYPIVRSIIDLGKNLNLTVVAEGVETEEAWNILAQEKCDFIQGYLISRPLEIDKFLEFLKTNIVLEKEKIRGQRKGPFY